MYATSGITQTIMEATGTSTVVSRINNLINTDITRITFETNATIYFLKIKPYIFFV